ncbi:hypothetical protein BD770DRAFT_300236, partial [Pilaira anomala]
FKKTIPAGANECCHYTNKDCSPNGKVDDIITFTLVFIWADHQTTGYTVRCTTGGGLVIHGNEENQFALCQDA